MMNRAKLHMERTRARIAMLPFEQRTEVAKMLKEIQDVISSASNETVASATIELFGAIAFASQVDAEQMTNSGSTH